MYAETSSLRILKIMSSNLNESTFMNSAAVLFSKVLYMYSMQYIYIYLPVNEN